MSSQEKSALLIANRYRDVFKKIGLNTGEVSKENYSYSFTIKENNQSNKILIYFGKKGIKTVIQGDKSELYNKIYSNVFGDKLLPDDTNFKEPEKYIGTDESGKGDYFGPLVTAGVLADDVSKKELVQLGVRDSKELTDQSINKIAREIKKILQDKFEIVKINPEKYNELYEKMKNVNIILGWAHARVIENLLMKFKVENAISDKFGNEKTIINSLMKKGKIINLHQETKAEKYTAVAAASILARAEMLRWFESKSKELDFKIPKGASARVDQAAIELKNKLGEEELKKLIKLHFKTSKKIFK